MGSPWIRCFFGPDFIRGEGWCFSALILPRRDLMDSREVGRMILCGLQLDVSFRWPWGIRDAWWWWKGDDNGWRVPIRLCASSDAGEIASRLARSAGWEVFDALPRLP